MRKADDKSIGVFGEDIDANESILEANYVYRLLHPEIAWKDIKLLKPNLKKGTSMTGENRAVVILDQSLPKDLAELDYNAGAKPFKAFVDVSPVDINARVKVIVANSEEEGLIGMEYLATRRMKEAESHGFFTSLETYDIKSDDPDELVYANVIPIIQIHELMCQTNGNIGFGLGDDLFGSAGTIPLRKPAFWKMFDGAIAVISSKGYGIYSDELTDMLHTLDNNTAVYLIYNVGDDTVSQEDGEMYENELIRTIIEYNASVFCVDSGCRNIYYRKILQVMCAKNKVQIAKDFPMDEFITKVFSIAREKPADFLEKIVVRIATRNKAHILDDSALELVGKAMKESARLTGWELIDSLNGMSNVKEQIKSLVNDMKYNKGRKGLGLMSNPIVALCFVGQPGTAKTTMARALGDICTQEGLLPGSNRFIALPAAELQGVYLGSTPQKIKSIFEENDIIFIDEAYSLTDHIKDNMYAAEALACLCTALEDAQLKQNKLVIFAGYGGSEMPSSENKMKTFLNANPGIKSRVAATVEFSSYSVDECIDIFFKICSNTGYTFDDESERSEIKDMLKGFFEQRKLDPSFGNGRECRTLVGESVRFAAHRVMDGRSVEDVDESEYKSLTVNDIRNAVLSLKKMEKSGNGAVVSKMSFLA